MGRLLVAFMLLLSPVRLAGDEESLSEGLVATWDWENGSAPYDIRGGIQVNGKTGTGVYLDGISDFVATNQSCSFNEFSVDAWIYPMGMKGAQTIFSNGTLSALGAGFTLQIQGSDSIGVVFYDSAGKRQAVKAKCLLKEAEWQHIAMTYGGSRISLYHNGVKCGGVDVAGFSKCDDSLVIGAWRYANVMNFNGALDACRLWKRCLSGDEITELHKREAAVVSKPPMPMNDAFAGLPLEAIDISGQWKMKRLANVIESSQFALQGEAELKRDSSAWGWLAATPGGSEHCSLVCSWAHLDFKDGVKYKASIHYKANGLAGGGALDGWRLSFKLPSTGGSWQDQVVGPFDPKKLKNVVFYGPETLFIDSVSLFADGSEPPQLRNSKLWDLKSASNAAEIEVPSRWDEKTDIPGRGVSLLRREVELPQGLKGSTGRLLFRTGVVAGSISVSFNGLPMLEVSRNIYAVPLSMASWRKANSLELKIAGLSTQGGRCILKGPIGLFYSPSPDLAEWTKAPHVRRIAVDSPGKMEAVLPYIKQSLKRKELLSVKFSILKDGKAMSELGLEASFGGERIPVLNNWRQGEFQMWISSREEGRKKLELQIENGVQPPMRVLLAEIEVGGEIATQQEDFNARKLLTGAWIPPNEGDVGRLLPLLKTLGFNTIIMPPRTKSQPQWDSLRKSLRECGLKLIVYPPALRNADGKDLAALHDELAAFGSSWKDCPDLLAYGVLDEVSMEDLKKWTFMRMFLESVDPIHPVTVVLNQNSMKQVNFANMDVFHRDIYYELPLFKKEAARAREIAENAHVPLWTTIAAGNSPGVFRAQCRDALLNGTNGLFLFQVYDIYKEDVKWRGFIKRSDLTLLPQATVVEEVLRKATTMAPLLGSLSNGNERLAKTTNKSVELRTKRNDEGNLYVLALNESTAMDVEFEIALELMPDVSGCIAVDLSNGQNAPVSNRGYISGKLAAGDWTIYKLTVATKPSSK